MSAVDQIIEEVARQEAAAMPMSQERFRLGHLVVAARREITDLNHRLENVEDDLARLQTQLDRIIKARVLTQNLSSEAE